MRNQGRDCPELAAWERRALAAPLSMAAILFMASFLVTTPAFARSAAVFFLALAQVWVAACLRQKSKLMVSKRFGFYLGILCSLAAIAVIVVWGAAQLPHPTDESYNLLFGILNPIMLTYGILQTMESAGVFGTESE